MPTQIKVRTITNDAGEIVSEIIGDFGELLMRHVLATREKQVHDALVSLGWTPPPDTSVCNEKGSSDVATD